MRDSLLTFRRPLLRDTFYPAGNVLNNVLLGARTTLGLHDNYEAAQALLVVQRPQLDGTVVDEIAGHSAGAVGGKASDVCSGAEQITGTADGGASSGYYDNTDFAALVGFQGNGPLQHRERRMAYLQTR